MKTIAVETAVAIIPDGASVMIGGFMGVGTPTGARRVIVAMQHTAQGKPKIVRHCSLPLTWVRPVDLLVTELAVIAFGSSRPTLLETAPDVSVEEVLSATEADLVVPERVQQMNIKGV